MVDAVHRATEMTHNTVIAQVASSAYCLLIRNILLQKGEKVFDFLEDYYRTVKKDEHAEKLVYLKNWKTSHRPNGSSEVENCFWSAWQAYSLYERDFRLCLYSAVQMGNNANATASVAGSFAGLSNGLEDIPQRWLSTIALSPEVMDTITTFTNTVVNRISS